MTTRVSAPGKCILMGEHAAVYGQPALVAAVDRRATVELTLRSDHSLVLDLPQVGIREDVPWDAVLTYTARCCEAWEAYRENPDPAVFQRVRGDDPAHLVKIALGEAAVHVGDREPPGMAVRLDSAIPLGSGFGSSAAAAVALVEAYLAARGGGLESAELHRLTLEVERRQHGLPSGIDNATVIHGGLVWTRKEASGVMTVKPLKVLSPVLGEIRLFHSGPPAEPTGAVVAAVKERRESDPEHYDAVLAGMGEATCALRRELELEVVRPDRILEIVRAYEAGLEELGTVPVAIRELVRRVEERGGAAKISGAGALTGRGGGALLVYHPQSDEIDGWDFLDGLERLDLTLGAPGVRRERHPD